MSILKYVIFGLSLLIPISLLGTDKQDIERGHELFASKDYDGAYKIWNEVYDRVMLQEDVTSKIEILDLVSKSLTHQFKMDEALGYMMKADSLAILNNLLDIHYNLVASKISLWNYLGKRDRSFVAAQKALEEENLSLGLRSDFNQAIGYYYEYEGDVDNSIVYHKKAYDLDKELIDSSSFPFSALAYGICVSRKGDQEKALELMLEGLSWLRGEKDKFKAASFYSRIQSLLLKERNYKKAEEYGLKGLEIAEANNITMTKARILLGLYQVYLDKRDYSTALNMLREASSTFSSKGATERLYNTHNAKAEVFLAMNEMDSSAYYLQEANQLEDEIKEVPSDRLLHEYVGAEWAAKNGNNLESISLYRSCLATALEIKSKYWEKDIRNELANLLALEGQHQEALTHFKIYEALKDSIFIAAQTKTVNELETKYRTAEQRKEIAELNRENEHRKSVTRASLAALLLSLFGALFVFGLYRINKRNKLVVEEKNKVIFKALAEKDLLLKEIHHRVKNNLQVISSLLNLQSKFIEDDMALSVLNEGKNRVKSMALIHQNLYQEDNLAGIQIKSYFEELCETLFESYNISEGQIELVTDIEEMLLDVDTVIPIGLIMNELITNALKYAFPDQRNGMITIDLHERNNQLHLAVNDNGLGMEKEALSNKKSFGHKLIEAFLKKLDATIVFAGDTGTSVSLVINKYEKVK